MDGLNEDNYNIYVAKPFVYTVDLNLYNNIYVAKPFVYTVDLNYFPF